MMIIEKETNNDTNIPLKNKEENFISNETTEEINKKFHPGIYELNFIGKGGSSKIYEGKVQKTKTNVIIKVMEKGKNIGNNINEVKIMSKLRNKNIITMYGYSVGKKSKCNFIMMEKGKYDLRNFLNKVLKRRISSETFLNFIAFQIMKGLFYLYKNNIVHYDIKPQNIIITDFLDAKIIDFSVSKYIGDIKDEKVQLHYRGTSFYMAPEVIKTDTINVQDYHKIDLFSLGVMLYVLAFGERPFNLNHDDCNNDETIYNKMMTDWKVENINGTEYSPHFLNFLNRLLETDIEKRMNIYEAMNHYWIKGGYILMEEKENICNANVFLTDLITDHFSTFNDYLQQNSSEN